MSVKFSNTLGKCNRPGFSLGRKLYHCRSLHIYLQFYMKDWVALEICDFFLSAILFSPVLSWVQELFPAVTLPLLSHRPGSHGCTVRTDEYESLSFVCFSGSSVIKDVIFGCFNLFLF